jgi:hypothetical protein
MTKSTAESAELLCHNHGDVFIGADFYVVEPNLTFQTISESVAVLSLTTKQLNPFKDCVAADSQAFRTSTSSLKLRKMTYIASTFRPTFPAQVFNVTKGGC